MSLANVQVENWEWTLEGNWCLMVLASTSVEGMLSKGAYEIGRDSLLASQASSLILPCSLHRAFTYLFGVWLWVMVLASSSTAHPLTL